MRPINEKDLEGLMVNPFYAVVFADYLFRERKHLSAKEDWILLNAQLIKDMGSKKWLSELLDVVSQSRARYDGDEAINPTLAINISNRLEGDHPPLVTREQWIQANANLIDELGVDAWLWRLLDTLETGGPESAE